MKSIPLTDTSHKFLSGLSTLGRHALLYTMHYRWHVFPVRPATKHPMFAGWPEVATDDLSIITKWCTTTPRANIGLLTGPESGIVVADIDCKDGAPGLDTWAELLDIHGPVDTLTSITGSGGAHYFFQQPPGVDLRSSQGNLGRGIDTRAWHGYVILPPSVHPSGRLYEWDTQQPPAPLPAWLLAKWQQFSPKSTSQTSTRGQPLSDGLQQFVHETCQNWGLRLEHNGQYRGACPFPHYDGDCDCDRAFCVDPRTGHWLCFCPDHPKTDDVLQAGGWLVSSHSKPKLQSHQPRRRGYLPTVEVSL